MKGDPWELFLKLVAGLFIILSVAAFALALSGCATPPPAPEPIAQCIELVAGQTIYTTDRIRAAEWCAANMGYLK